MTPIAADDEVGADLERPVGCFGAYAREAPGLLDQIDGFGPQAQMKAWGALAVRGEEIEEIPLRHQCDELATRRQVAEVDEGELLAPECAADRARFAVRQLEERIEQAELGHDLERRGMNGVAAKVA